MPSLKTSGRSSFNSVNNPPTIPSVWIHYETTQEKPLRWAPALITHLQRATDLSRVSAVVRGQVVNHATNLATNQSTAAQTSSLAQTLTAQTPTAQSKVDLNHPQNTPPLTQRERPILPFFKRVDCFQKVQSLLKKNRYAFVTLTLTRQNLSEALQELTYLNRKYLHASLVVLLDDEFEDPERTQLESLLFITGVKMIYSSPRKINQLLPLFFQHEAYSQLSQDENLAKISIPEKLWASLPWQDPTGEVI